MSVILSIILIVAAALTAAPLVGRSTGVQKAIVFASGDSNPNDNKPSATRNFYLTVDGEQFGVWHMLPSSAGIPDLDHEDEMSYYHDALRDPDATIILYLHGNGGDRANGGRLPLYKLLRSLNYHVFAIDYRSYGDSDDTYLSEESVVADALKTYEYITDRTDRPIFIWGHSLGTAVATHMCSDLQRLGKPSPKGVILEAPFTNMQDELRGNSFGNIMSYHPLFKFGVADAIYKNKLRFESDEHILEFSAPVMILHARDDVVVPYDLGHRLYLIGSSQRLSGTGPVEFHSFDENREFGHMEIYRAPELKGLVENFVHKYREKKFAEYYYDHKISKMLEAINNAMSTIYLPIKTTNKD